MKTVRKGDLTLFRNSISYNVRLVTFKKLYMFVKQFHSYEDTKNNMFIRFRGKEENK
jgi:hypothetical protein